MLVPNTKTERIMPVINVSLSVFFKTFILTSNKIRFLPEIYVRIVSYVKYIIPKKSWFVKVEQGFLPMQYLAETEKKRNTGNNWNYFFKVLAKRFNI